MQIFAITLVLILLGTGLVLNTSVLVYFVVRSFRVIRPAGKQLVLPTQNPLALAQR